MLGLTSLDVHFSIFKVTKKIIFETKCCWEYPEKIIKMETSLDTKDFKFIYDKEIRLAGHVKYVANLGFATKSEKIVD